MAGRQRATATVDGGNGRSGAGSEGRRNPTEHGAYSLDLEEPPPPPLLPPPPPPPPACVGELGKWAFTAEHVVRVPCRLHTGKEALVHSGGTLGDSTGLALTSDFCAAALAAPCSRALTVQRSPCAPNLPTTPSALPLHANTLYRHTGSETHRNDDAAKVLVALRGQVALGLAAPCGCGREALGALAAVPGAAGVDQAARCQPDVLRHRVHAAARGAMSMNIFERACCKV